MSQNLSPLHNDAIEDFAQKLPQLISINNVVEISTFFKRMAINVSTPSALILPSAGTPGRIIWDSGANKLKVDNGSNFEDIAVGATGDDLGNHIATQALDMAGFNITNIADLIGSGTMDITSNIADGASAVSHRLNTTNAINAVGSKIFSIVSDGVERLYVGNATSAWGVAGTRLELQRQAGGDRVFLQAESGFYGNFSTIEPENPWSFGVHTAKDWAGFTGGVAEWYCSPDGDSLGLYYPKEGSAEVGSRVWDWADYSSADSFVTRFDTDSYHCVMRTYNGTLNDASMIIVHSQDSSYLGITDARMATKAANEYVLAAGISGLGIKASLKIDSTQVLGPQGAAVADATDAASVILRLNDLLARCRAHGLIAT